jgi:2',3'-cyclic-nucleotide 2'-phosphodiesterase (5'-nucleotidase family)
MKRFQLFLWPLLFFSYTSHARLLQIIHTNDLHSYFTGYNDGSGGGYARVRTKIKELRQAAAQKNIDVLQVDAGDWGEGTSFFLADKGKSSLNALELLGAEVATIGNHDHLVGGKVLAQQIRSSNISTKFTVANVVPTPDMAWNGTITPYVDIDRAGIKIRVIGLTTDEAYFRYSMAPGLIASPVTIGEQEAQKAKAAGRELVIALTHIGQSRDRSLAQNSTAIDVIIGGHTHTKLTEIDWEKNKKGKSVPIVQAWAHGLAVGTLLLDVDDNGNAKVVEYKLHEIDNSVAQDAQMAALIESASPQRNDNLAFPFDEVIGVTQTPIAGYKAGRPVVRSSCWGHHMARAARTAVGAAVGVHISQFEGMSKPPGPVTYSDIANSFPHFRKYGDQGWEIATVLMSGIKLRFFMSWISSHGYGVSFSGLGYRVAPEEDEKAVYRVAFPAEVALAIKTSLPGYRKYLQGLQYTGKYYWTVFADYLRKNTPISCSNIDD